MDKPSKFWVVSVNNYLCDASYSGKELKVKHKFPSFRQFHFIRSWEELRHFKERSNITNEALVKECLTLCTQTKQTERMTRRTYSSCCNAPEELIEELLQVATGKDLISITIRKAIKDKAPHAEIFEYIKSQAKVNLRMMAEVLGVELTEKILST